jgi:hypothetical protein
MVRMEHGEGLAAPANNYRHAGSEAYAGYS